MEFKPCDFHSFYFLTINNNNFSIDKLSILVQNFRGLGKKEKREKIRTICKPFDIVIGSETHFTPQTEKNFSLELGATSVVSDGNTSNARGAAILLNQMDRLQEHDYKSGTGRLTTTVIDSQLGKIGIASVYAPNISDKKT